METALEQAMQLNTYFIPLMNLLAHHYATKGHNLPKAEQLMSEILKRDNTNPHLLDTHALILYKKTNYTEALALLQRLQTNVPHDATIALHLAQTHYKLNNKTAAHTALRNAQAMAKSAYEKNKITQLAEKWNIK